MKIDGIPHRTIEVVPGTRTVRIIDQTLLPHHLEWLTLSTLTDAAAAIKDMHVRGAPLIGATAGYGLALALQEDASDTALQHAYETLYATRPTAVNLRWALDRVRRLVSRLPVDQRAAAAWQDAAAICDEDARTNHAIGQHGLELLRQLHAAKADRSAPLTVMTHCNAGWLAAVDWGMSLSPVYLAHDAGIPVHVWVSETRPRGQGASLTAWELSEHGVPHTLIADNASGHLMQRGLVDACIVGADRVTSHGDVANKIGTYMKALAARAHDVPFYVAMPVSTIDWTIADGVRDIPIEQRSAREVTHMPGLADDGTRHEVLITRAGTQARNDGFDVTPAAFVTALITEHGVFKANAEDLARLQSVLA